ncbi:MAG: hypothetical protein M1839_004735 [Geoglossum umbratile]|nr:MAG: hypothetical protein M1839_004735 [Geoglossum umbratile]
MATLKRGRGPVPPATPDISLPTREGGRQLEVGEASIPTKKRRIVSGLGQNGGPSAYGNPVLAKVEVGNKGNISLGPQRDMDVEVIDLLDGDEETEETGVCITEGKVAPELGVGKPLGINVGLPKGIQVKPDNKGGDRSSEERCFSTPPRNVASKLKGPRARATAIPGVKSKNKDGKLTEEDQINKAANLCNAMPDLDDGDTEWMDQIIHSRPSANGALNRLELDENGGVQLTQEEIMNYLSNLENRPGHVKRRRRLVKAKDFYAENQATIKAENVVVSEVSSETKSPDKAGSGHHEEGDEDVDPIQEEKDRVIEAARQLGCKRKRKLVVRREEVTDHPILDTQEVGALAEDVKVKHESEDLIFIAEGPDGRPRRYRRVEELRTFWTVPGMTTPLLDHQILGVDWMVNDKELAEKGIHGGLVADMMGLGKTMQAIATMVLNKPPADSVPKDPHVTLIVAPTALLQQWKQEIEQHTAEGEFEVFIHHGSNKIKSLQHLRAQDVVITSYHTIMRSHPKTKRPNRAMSKEEVQEWWDEMWETRKEFHRIKFWRVILDECHSIKNYRARTSAACTSLRAVHKWAISGTPIQNSLFDVYPLFRFLGNRFSDLPAFKSVFGITKFNGAARATKAMQVELAPLMMRRSKEDMLCGRKLLDLTPKVILVTEVEFSPEERQLYKVVEASSIEKVNNLRRSKGESEFFLVALVMLMRLRQICNHPYLIMDAIKKDFSIDELKAALEMESEIESVTNPNTAADDDEDDLPEDIIGAISRRRPAAGATSGLRRILQIAQSEAAGDSGQCSICLDIPEDPVMTNCRHVFCQGCITAVIQRAAMDNGDEGDGAQCPLCKREITDKELRAYLPKPTEDGADASEESLGNKHWLDQVRTLMPSAKMKALKEQLNTWRETRPNDKIIIFSQFVKMLDLVELLCDDEGHETVRYTGGTTLKVREAALKRFKHDPDCAIMLTSLRAGGVGLNLTEANLVLSIDMWWNAAVEHQAFDRVHRLGQTKEVFVQRYIVKETVEQRIRMLQEGKLKVAAAAMGEGLGRVQKLGMRELMGLFGKVIRGEDGIDMVIQAP